MSNLDDDKQMMIVNNDKTPPKESTAPQQETGGDCVRCLVRLVCGFPGVGKSHLCRKMGWQDSDSSQFSHRDGWPNNYIEHLKEMEGVALVSTHKEVRDALADAGMPFDLCYPSRELKQDYLARYQQRGSPVTFVELLDRMWDEWITEMEDETRCDARFILGVGEFASDVISEPNTEVSREVRHEPS